MSYNHLPVTPEEDEIFSKLENPPNEHMRLAVIEAQRFVESRSAAELSITTLRKAFEMGYLTAWEEQLRKQLAAQQTELFGLQTR